MHAVTSPAKTIGTFVDFNALSHTEFHRAPYAHVVVPHFVRAERLAEVERDFPELGQRGSYLPGICGLAGGAMKGLLGELRSRTFQEALSERLNVDLTTKWQLITLRGSSGENDGAIHTDSKSKIATAIIYPSCHWPRSEGALRILNSPTDLNNFVAEIPPCDGNLVAFVRSENSYHGYLPHVGKRPIVQVQWLDTTGRYFWDKLRLAVGTFGKRFLDD